MDGEKYTTPRDTRDRLEQSDEGGASLVGDSHGASDSTTVHRPDPDITRYLTRYLTRYRPTPPS